MNWPGKLMQRAKALERDTLAVWFAYRDERTPRKARIVAAIVTAYAFSPIDLIPDFIPILGYLDDLILVPVGITLALRMIPPQVMADARAKAARHLTEKKPVSWLVGTLIILTWVGILTAIGSGIWRAFRP
jgi:uncharacterized membrane protein YkvA (DUF1232 family)